MKLFSTYIILCSKLLNNIKIPNLLNVFKHPRKYFSKIFHSAHFFGQHEQNPKFLQIAQTFWCSFENPSNANVSI
jgi:hypothetical protein